MNVILANLALITIGLAGGLVVGTGMVALLVVLDIIPRLVQVARSYRSVRTFEGAIVLGAVIWTAADFFDWQLTLWPWWTALIGLFAGCFVGMLAAALTEVINVLPILARRLQLGHYIGWLFLAMICGKVIGSLFDWLVFSRLMEG